MTRSSRLIPHQRADGWCESAKGFIKAKSPQSGEPEKFLSKADGARPLQRGAMLVAVSGRLLRRQEEWYRKIFNYFVSEILSLYYF